VGFEDKYGVVEDESIKEFHKSRTMFAILLNKLYISEQTDKSHAAWFKSEGWITESDDSLMNVIIRGYVDKSGIYFYRGYDFIATEEDESKFLSKLSELKEKLKLVEDLAVYAGVVKTENVKQYPPKKMLGKLSKLLN